MWLAAHPAVLTATFALAILWFAEGAIPYFGRPSRSRHALCNVTLGLINGAIRATFFPAALLYVAEATRPSGFGLLRQQSLPPWLVAVLAVLSLDLLNYSWHVASHHIPFLWRFHAVHHHDDAPDSTTAFRFHAGDVVAQSLVLIAAAGLLGLEVWHILLYEALLIPASLFHHANLRLSPAFDRALGWLIVTPNMHWVHHSRWVAETDSNFAGIFSLWDRLFGTLRLRQDADHLRFGLDGYERCDHGTLRGCLLTPLGPVKSEPGHDTRREHPMPAASIRTIPRCPPPKTAPLPSPLPSPG